MKTPLEKFVIVLPFIIVFSYLALIVWIEPRPSYILETDSEIGYYYSGLLMRDGIQPSTKPGEFVSHPGTPVRYIYSLLTTIPKLYLKNLNAFFFILYFFNALAAALCLSCLTYFVLRKSSLSVALLVLASIVSWPFFLFYLGYFSSDSLTPTLGLITLLVFWRSLGKRQLDSKTLGLIGILAGLCLSTKLTFIPVVAALVVGISVHILFAAWYDRKNIFSLLIVPITAICTFALFNLPFRNELPYFYSFNRYRLHVMPAFGSVLGSAAKNLVTLGKTNLILTFLLVVVVLIYLAYATRLFFRHRDLLSYSTLRNQDCFSHVPGLTFLLVMLSGFVYTLSAANLNPGMKVMNPASWLGSPGVGFRNVYPSALLLPFMIIHTSVIGRQIIKPAYLNKAALRALIGITSVLLIAVAFGFHVYHRHEFIKSRTAENTAVREVMDSLAVPGTRTAYYDGDCSGIAGEASFFLYGSNRFSRNHYDSRLLDIYPDLSYLRLLDVIHEKDANNLTIHGDGNQKVGLIAFSETRFNYICRGGTLSLQKLFQLIESRFGQFDVVRSVVGNDTWLFLSLKNTYVSKDSD
jgi:hypothetical protein